MILGRAGWPVLPIVLVVALVAVAPVGAQSIFDDTASEQVEEATDLESVKTDLALCAPHLDRLRDGTDAEAVHESVEDPQCRKAILAAQRAGLSKSEIVDILMGASDVPDPGGFTVDHGGPPVVIR